MRLYLFSRATYGILVFYPHMIPRTGGSVGMDERSSKFMCDRTSYDNELQVYRITHTVPILCDSVIDQGYKTAYSKCNQIE